MADKTGGKILLTGATGNVGTELVKELRARAVPFRVMIRPGKKTSAPDATAGVEAVEGDFDNRESVKRALDGVERAFLLTNSSERTETQQLAFVEAAKGVGVKRIVYLSQWGTRPDSPLRFLRYHAAVEREIQGSGIGYTFLRPNFYMQSFLKFKQPIISQGKLFAAIGDQKVSVIDTRDIAEVAAAALVDDGHEGKTYSLTGPEGLSFAQVAAKLSAAIAKTVEFVSVPPEAMLQGLLGAGMPRWQAEGVIEDFTHYVLGEGAELTCAVQDATGKAPRSFDRFTQDYAQAFTEQSVKKVMAANIPGEPPANSSKR